MAVSQSAPIIIHDTPITLQLTGARDESGGSGIKAYHIYFDIVASGVEAPEVFDARYLDSIDHLTSIPSTLDPAGETTSGYPSWEASESASGIVRDHYHWDHVFTYDFDKWQSGMYHYFWCLAEDFAGNASILVSGVHPSNPFYQGTDEQVITSRNLEPRSSIGTNTLVLSGKGVLTGVWHWDGVDTVTVPTLSTIHVLNPEQSSYCTKTLPSGPTTVSGIGVSAPWLIYVSVTDWISDEVTPVNFIPLNEYPVLTGLDLVIGSIDRSGGGGNEGAITIFHGGKNKIKHAPTEMWGLTSDTHTQYLLIDGTRAMTGDLDLAVSGLVDNVDVDELDYILWSDVGVNIVSTGDAVQGEYVSDDTQRTKVWLTYYHKPNIKKIYLTCKLKRSGGSAGTITLDVNSSTQSITTTSATYEEKTTSAIDVSSLTSGTYYDIKILGQAGDEAQTVTMKCPSIYGTLK